jgi:methyl-accepting chemotaxis protein
LCIIAASVLVFSCAIVRFFWLSSYAQMEALLHEKTSLALQFDLAIRSYVSETIRPFAQAHTDANMHLDYDSNDEIGTVIASFNSMVDDLTESTTSIDDLHAANGQLKASQHQLQTANKQLGRNEQDLRQNMDRLMRFNRLAAKRELKMQDLKQEVNGLLAELGREHKYKDKAEIAKIYQRRYMGVEQR